MEELNKNLIKYKIELQEEMIWTNKQYDFDALYVGILKLQLSLVEDYVAFSDG